ncbi:hypothetical protein ALC57_05094, partial [Trachymyrmex cornetzi]
LVLLNQGRVSTFVGPRGESIIDLTWATPAAAQRIKGLHVDAGSLGELSDHRIIRMELVPTRVPRSKSCANLVLFLIGWMNNGGTNQ